MKTKIIALVAVLLILTGFRVQERTVTGIVTSADDGKPIPGVNVVVKGTSRGVVTNASGAYSISVPANGTLVFSFIGYVTREIKTSGRSVINVAMSLDVTQLSETVVTGYAGKRDRKMRAAESVAYDMIQQPVVYEGEPQWNTEEYDGINENIFHDALRNPLSTFSIDVDAASYSNVRRFINHGQRPPKDAVRIEEMINYFDYEYPQPGKEHPFSIITEVSAAPWNTNHKLVHIGLQGRTLPTDKLPPSNLVFLIDVSGSMSDPNKLPLLKTSFKMLVNQLREQDHVSIVVYAGAAGLVLKPTSGADKETIIEALDRLEAGGSTAGGAGIRLAYEVAREHFKREGNNRVILATDGDFNVGASSNGEMERLIEEKRKEGVFLTVLGYGMGNYKDSKMETLADKGNGNYAYIDNLEEARKVLVSEFGGTLFTIAKDVKLQIEFNPTKVKAYRLIGYENRMLKNEDFNNDKKDAGELGSGHTVTALYEIIPVGVDSEFYNVDALKYQTPKVNPQAEKTNELMTVKFRYKDPDSETSKLIVQPLIDKSVSLAQTSNNFRWSAAVAAFGMILRESEYVKGYTLNDVIQLAQESRGNDSEGYRIEFIRMVKSCESVARK